MMARSAREYVEGAEWSLQEADTIQNTHGSPAQVAQELADAQVRATLACVYAVQELTQAVLKVGYERP